MSDERSIWRFLVAAFAAIALTLALLPGCDDDSSGGDDDDMMMPDMVCSGGADDGMACMVDLDCAPPGTCVAAP